MERTIVASDCGHLYSTIWLAGISLKAIRMGDKRFQRCPVCHKHAWVTPADVSQLTAQEREKAEATVDSRVP